MCQFSNLLLVTVLFTLHFVANAYQCHDSKECIFGNISEYSNNIECYGYRSCEGSTMIEVVSTTRVDIECYGSYSCHEVNAMQHVNHNVISYFMWWII